MASAVASVSRVSAALCELVGRYEEMVVKDPSLTAKLESALRLASYILPGEVEGLGTRPSVRMGENKLPAKRASTRCTCTIALERHDLQGPGAVTTVGAAYTQL